MNEWLAYNRLSGTSLNCQQVLLTSSRRSQHLVVWSYQILELFDLGDL